MSHIHNDKEHNSTGNLRLAFFLNFIFSIIELVGGLITNSVAILSDAVHDFGDSISLGVAWYLQKKSNRLRDELYTYGYKRYSLLGAIIISVVLIVSSFFIIRESILRFFEPQQPNAQGMFLLAILGIAVNGFATWRMRKGHSFNERAVMVHLLEDVFGWIAVLIGSVIMYFYEVPFIDPLLSLGIAVWVLSNVYRNLRDTFKVLLQEVPQDVDVNTMLKSVTGIPGVIDVHDFHLWSLDGVNNIMTLHVVTETEITQEETKQIKEEIRKLVHDFKIDHITLEMESEAESDDCEFRDGC
jgi:cobalt-zinc-cadmium efflux system protein